MRVAVSQKRRLIAQRRLIDHIKRGDLVDPEYAENFWRYRHPNEE